MADKIKQYTKAVAISWILATTRATCTHTHMQNSRQVKCVGNTNMHSTTHPERSCVNTYEPRNNCDENTMTKRNRHNRQINNLRHTQILHSHTFQFPRTNLMAKRRSKSIRHRRECLSFALPAKASKKNKMQHRKEVGKKSRELYVNHTEMKLAAVNEWRKCEWLGHCGWCCITH